MNKQENEQTQMVGDTLKNRGEERTRGPSAVQKEAAAHTEENKVR